jgi:hypothetical protein
VTQTQMIGVTSTRVSRAERMAMPLAREVVRDVCVTGLRIREKDQAAAGRYAIRAAEPEPSFRDTLC